MNCQWLQCPGCRQSQPHWENSKKSVQTQALSLTWHHKVEHNITLSLCVRRGLSGEKCVANHKHARYWPNNSKLFATALKQIGHHRHSLQQWTHWVENIFVSVVYSPQVCDLCFLFQGIQKMKKSALENTIYKWSIKRRSPTTNTKTTDGLFGKNMVNTTVVIPEWRWRCVEVLLHEKSLVPEYLYL